VTSGLCLDFLLALRNLLTLRNADADADGASQNRGRGGGGKAWKA